MRVSSVRPIHLHGDIPKPVESLFTVDNRPDQDRGGQHRTDLQTDTWCHPSSPMTRGEGGGVFSCELVHPLVLLLFLFSVL